MENIRIKIRKSMMPILLKLGTQTNGYYSSQTLLAKELKLPLTTVNYQITKMKAQGLIQISKSPIILTNKGIKQFKYIWDNCDKTKLRCHNVQVVFEVKQCKVFPNPNEVYSPLNNGKYRGIKTKLKGFTCMFYSPKKIVCTLKDIFADTDEEISSDIQLQIPMLVSLLESEFNIKLGSHKIATIQRMHIAVLNSNIAKAYKLRGFTEENKEFAIDNSHGTPEIELTSTNALKDIMKLAKLDSQQVNPSSNADKVHVRLASLTPVAYSKQIQGGQNDRNL